MITKMKEGHHDYIGKIWNQSRKVYISNKMFIARYLVKN